MTDEMTETRPDYDEADEACVANALRQAFAEAISVLIEALPDDRTRRIEIPEVMAAETRAREALGRQRMN
jgi:hypothetical protein